MKAFVFSLSHYDICYSAKSRKYRGVFKVNCREKRHGKFGKTGLNIWSIIYILSKSQKGGRILVSGKVSVSCWRETPDKIRLSEHLQIVSLISGSNGSLSFI